MPQEKISVIVPVYNTQDYIEECVESIRMQTYKNLEIILVNDGSSDSSPQICDQYAGRDCRVVVIHKENGGLSSARNCGIERATGNYIGFVDSDDVIQNDMYELLHRALAACGADIAVCSKTKKKGELEKGCKRIRQLDRRETLKEMVLGEKFGSHACDKLFVSSIVKNSDGFPEGRLYEDLFTMYQWVGKSRKLVFCESKKYYYRPNQNGITLGAYRHADMDMIDGLMQVGYYLEKECPSLLIYQRMALTRAAVALLRKIIRDGTGDACEDRKRLVCILKEHRFLYLLSPYKLSNKLFALAASIDDERAFRIYRFLQREVRK